MKTTYNITASGLNIHHLIEALEKNNFEVSSLLRVDQKTMSFNISKQDYKKLKKLPIYSSYKFSVQKVLGAQSIFSRFLKRLGIVVGAVIVAFVCLGLGKRVLSVEINTSGHICQNEEYCIFKGENLEKLKEVLSENGIFEGAQIRSLANNRQVERTLIKTFPQISSVTISRKGVRVFVDVLESKLPASMMTGDLVASESGIVLSMDIISGVPLVKNGDIVIKGQSLVRASENVPVSAKIVLRSFFHDTTIYNENQIEYVKTGRTFTSHELSLFNHKSEKKDAPFDLYEAKVTNEYVFYNLFLPLKSKVTTFFELEAKESVVPFEQKESDIKMSLYNKVKSALPINCEEVNTTYITYKEGPRTRVDCYIEVRLTLEK